MTKTKSILPFISLLIIVTVALTPLITAEFDGGFDGGGFDGGFDGGGFDGGFDGGGLDGGFDGGGFDGGFDGGSDDGGFGGDSYDGYPDPTGDFPEPGPGDFDPIPGPSGPATPPEPSDTPFPPDPFPAGPKWNTLTDKTIYQASRDNTIVYSNLALECTDTKATTVSVASTHSKFNLAFLGYDLVIQNLDPFFVGTEKLTVDCNGLKASFNLNVIPYTSQPRPTETDGDDIGVFIGTIRIPNAYDSMAGESVPVTITIENNGDKKLENVEVTVVIQDLAIRASAGPFDLSVNKKASKTLLIELPEDVEPGTYYARVSINSGSVHRVKHRDIEVIA
ncbi:MAG TPA: hypothetical protein VI612_04515 [Candidatus Nanoarchaeia archaeon]|nr:hypothetical protein [Candidatus Nanoarchaeia archaeon]